MPTSPMTTTEIVLAAAMVILFLADIIINIHTMRRVEALEKRADNDVLVAVVAAKHLIEEQERACRSST